MSYYTDFVVTIQSSKPLISMNYAEGGKILNIWENKGNNT